MLKITRKSFTAVVCLIVACLQSTTGLAEEFDVRDGADEQLQSRQFDIDDPQVLLRACLAVIQDIKFHVTESELQPGLLVAESRPPASQTLTVSLLELPDHRQGYRVRLSMSGASALRTFGKARPVDYTNFYQDFFNHLNRELFQELQIP